MQTVFCSPWKAIAEAFIVTEKLIFLYLLQDFSDVIAYLAFQLLSKFAMADLVVNLKLASGFWSIFKLECNANVEYKKQAARKCLYTGGKYI